MGVGAAVSCGCCPAVLAVAAVVGVLGSPAVTVTAPSTALSSLRLSVKYCAQQSASEQQAKALPGITVMCQISLQDVHVSRVTICTVLPWLECCSRWSSDGSGMQSCSQWRRHSMYRQTCWQFGAKCAAAVAKDFLISCSPCETLNGVQKWVYYSRR